jgi:ABC-2 type transport system permease protein
VADLEPNSPRVPAGEGPFSPLARAQYSALVWVQLRMFLNSLRTRRGGVELGARVVVGIIFTCIALGPSFGLGFGAWVAITHGTFEGIAILLWVLTLAWQFFATLAPALGGQNPELNHLLRYPVGLRSWIILYLVYGLAAPSTLIGVIWATAVTIGITVARPGLIFWAPLALGVFVLFNLLLARTILAWIERWLAQRRTREIATAVFLFLALAAQTLNPVYHPNSNRNHSLTAGQKQEFNRVADRVMSLQRVLPPGLAADSIQRMAQGDPLFAFTDLLWLGCYTLAAGSLLALRLQSESHGENLSEAPRRLTSAARKARRPPALNFSGPIAAVFEKDLRYLLRSGPMLYNLAAPLVMVFVFGGAFRGGQFTSSIRFEYALPIAMVWAFLGLARIISNNLGMDGDGIQFYFLSPTPMRSVILGKNLLHLLLFLMEAILISAVVTYRFGFPTSNAVAVTIVWLLFAIPANFAIGNLLSITMPYRINMTRMRRETGAVGNNLTSFLTQLGILAVGAMVLVPCVLLGHPWLPVPILLVLTAISFFFYLQVLSRIDGMVQSRIDSLTLEVMKTR